MIRLYRELYEEVIQKMAGIGFELKNCLTAGDCLLPSELTDMRESYVPVQCFLELYCFLVLCIFVIKQEAADTAGNFWCV